MAIEMWVVRGSGDRVVRRRRGIVPRLGRSRNGRERPAGAIGCRSRGRVVQADMRRRVAGRGASAEVRRRRGQVPAAATATAAKRKRIGAADAAAGVQVGQRVASIKSAKGRERLPLGPVRTQVGGGPWQRRRRITEARAAAEAAAAAEATAAAAAVPVPAAAAVHVPVPVPFSVAVRGAGELERVRRQRRGEWVGLRRPAVVGKVVVGEELVDVGDAW